MELTEFALRLMLLFFPGIICFYIIETLTVHRERPTHEVLLRCFIYGIFSYLAYAGVLALLNCSWCERTASYDFPDQVSILKSSFNQNATPNISEIFLTTVIATILGLLFSCAIAHKWPNDFGQWTKISKKFGDPNVWSRTFNSGTAQWATIRDLENGQMYAGYVEAFSDVEDVAELLLSHVIVYNEHTGEELYQADHMYLSRRRDNLTVEIPNPPVESVATPVSSDPPAAQLQTSSPPNPPPPSEPPSRPTKKARRKHGRR